MPIVAAVAEALGLPGIGSETAHAMTHKVAMRYRLADAGVPQPRFAAARTLHEARVAAETVGYPAVLKPADSAGQRGIFLLESPDDLDAHLHSALSASTAGEAILESFHQGLEVNTLLVASGGRVRLITASDRLRPEGRGFGVALAHLYPSTVFGDTLAEVERVAVATVHALGLRDGVAYPQLLVSEASVRVDRGGGARAGRARWTRCRATASGSTWSRRRCGSRSARTCRTSCSSRAFQQPLAIRFLTAEPGPLTPGVVEQVGTLDRARALPGVVRVDAGPSRARRSGRCRSTATGAAT